MHATLAELAWTAQEAKGLQRHLIYNVTSFTEYNAKALTISSQPLFVMLDSGIYLLSLCLYLSITSHSQHEDQWDEGAPCLLFQKQKLFFTKKLKP